MASGKSVGIAAAAAIVVLAHHAHAQDVFVAGVHPERRPENAPTITTFDKTDAWYAQALAGVSEPVPPSLKFLDDQGAWFTPFTHPGMTGPYDIRHWHHGK